MKTSQLTKSLIILLFMLGPIFTIAQTAISNVSINNEYYLVTLVKTDGIYTITFKLDGKENARASTPNFNPSFVNAQMHRINCLALDSTITNCTLKDSIIEELKVKATKLFVDLLYTYANEDSDKGQKIAEITLKKNVPVYTKIKLNLIPKENIAKNDSGNLKSLKFNGTEYTLTDNNIKFLCNKRKILPDQKYAIIKDIIALNNCQLVFENGFIASIIVTGTINNKKVVFSSKYSIGVSTRKNIIDFSQIRLFDESGNTQGYIRLNEVINYERINDIYTRDYSPMDGKVVLNKAESQKSVFKSSKSKLFRLNIFSDFVGINENNPNGIIQIEVDKRINIWTKRISKVSGFTFVTPYFEWSKIEEHNRTLQFSEVSGTNYVSPLEVYRHKMTETGLLLNLFEGDGAVFNFQVNLLTALSFTQLQDSILQINKEPIAINERINSFIAGGEFKLTFSPEKAWGMVLSTRPFYYSNMNAAIPYYSLKENVSKQNLEQPKKWLNDLSLLITLRLGENSDNLFFARLGFIHELQNVSNNFAEVQLGYSMYLKTATKK